MNADEENIYVGFKCLCSKELLANGGSEMLQADYSDFACPDAEKIPDFDVTLKISTAGMPQTQKVSKKMSEEEATAVRENNEKVREERQKLADAITLRVSKFKRDFMGSPIRKALLEIAEDKQVAACCIPYRADEKYWIYGS